MSKREIWNWWRSKGYSKKATAAIMGNIQEESAFISNNVEDRCPMTDAEYTAKVDNGQISKQSFCHDSYGYGYYQHTFWSRKAGLFDLCKKKGKSISDPDCQHEWAETELHQAEYLEVYKVLKSNASLAEMTRTFMLKFEKPAGQTEGYINRRIANAQAIYTEFKDESKPDTPPAESYWPPRMIDKNMTGPDVFALQGVLCARGYYKGNMTGRFDDILESAVKSFQKDFGLSQDGVAGPLTWKKVLEV